MEDTPRLRAVEAFQVQAEGGVLLCLRDPQGFAEQPIFLNNILAFLVSRMDGQNSLRDIQADYMRATGEILPLDEIQGVVRQLDDHLFLESSRFRSFYENMLEEFRRAPVRPPRHAGAAYSQDPQDLAREIREFYRDPEGPGPDTAPNPSLPLRGLVAPHIDLHRGGSAYAHGYRALAEHPGADRFILFGTCHTPMVQRFALTTKDYQTPLGLVGTDGDFVRSLAGKLPRDYFIDEFSHRAEHSLEFQAVFLRDTLQDREFKIIPILVGSFHDLYDAGGPAAEEEELQAFVEGVRKTMAEMPAAYAVVAGADLAHVGRRFGDSSGPNERSLAEVAEEDRRFLEIVAAGDAEGAFRSIAADRDRRRVCGLPPIYMMLRCLDNPRGKLLQYRQWSDLKSGAAVTFASLALF